MKVAIASAALSVLLAGLVGLGARATYGSPTSADEPYYLLTARSLATDGDLDLRDEIAALEHLPYHPIALDEQTTPLVDGRRVSPHDPLLPLLLAPAMALPPHLGWLAAKATLVLLAAALAGLSVWVAVRRFQVSPPVAALVVGGLGASMPLAAYASQVYPEVPAALATTAAVAVGTASVLRWRHLIGVAALVVALPWLAIKTTPVAGALFFLVAWRAWRQGSRRQVLMIGLAVAAAGVLYLIGHQSLYGGWTAYSAGDHFVTTGEMGVIGSSPNHLGRARRLVGLLVDRAYGIGMWTPLWLGAPAAVSWAVSRASSDRAAAGNGAARSGELGMLLWPTAAAWLTATFVALTMHGWWSPGRQLVVVLPLLAIVVAMAAEHVRVSTSRPAMAGAALFGLLLAGVTNWLHLAWRATTGGPVLIVDFAELQNPVRRLLAAIGPDGIAGTLADDLGLVVWAIAFAAAAMIAWRRGARPSRPSSSQPALDPAEQGSAQGPAVRELV